MLADPTKPAPMQDDPDLILALDIRINALLLLLIGGVEVVLIKS